MDRLIAEAAKTVAKPVNEVAINRIKETESKPVAKAVPIQPKQSAASYPPISRGDDFKIRNGTLLKYKAKGGINYYADIPNSVSKIGRKAFYGCFGLSDIIIPNSVTSIGDQAFFGCIPLESIYISKSVTSIGDWAFGGCSGLTSITIPDSVTEIGESAFYGCSGLESITVDKGNKTYHSAGNCLIKTESKTLIAGCKNSIIPADGSVTEIWEYAFGGCSGLTSITIPNSVTEIWDFAFEGCSGLTSITIPDSVGYIGRGAFKDCPAKIYCHRKEPLEWPIDWDKSLKRRIIWDK